MHVRAQVRWCTSQSGALRRGLALQALLLTPLWCSKQMVFGDVFHRSFLLGVILGKRISNSKLYRNTGFHQVGDVSVHLHLA